MPYKMLIDGELVEGAATLDVINPATGVVVETAARADKAQLNAAVAAAKAAFPAWSALEAGERQGRLEEIASAMEAKADMLARLLTQEQGKPLAEALGEVAMATAVLRTFAPMRLETHVLRETASERILEQWAPLGVVGAIMPWNFPLFLLMTKLAPALLTGNTMVAKPAPTTPLTTLAFGEIAAPFLPAGVLNIIVDANDLGSAMAAHPDIAKVAFTGSTTTGKQVMRSVSDSLKRLTLELGGNDAAIVLDDADIESAAPKIFAGAMSNAGQICLATKRVYAHASVYDALCDELARLANDAVVDDGLAQGVTMGPVQNKQQFEKVKDYLADARTHGNVIAGGEALPREGYFIAPTIVRDVPEDARVVQEEQFGPILPVMSFDDVEDAIARTNATEYGLGGSVWTSDIERGLAVASRIESGTVWINKVLEVPFDIPFRGAKQSGMGVENGIEGMKEYAQARIVNIAL